jgi:dolichol-phosphate mannosyltransferase
MKLLIIIPTYNEKENIKRIIQAIKKINKNYHILVVDDNSPDKTWQIVENIRKKDKTIHLIKNLTKIGLGPAYIEGFRYSFRKKFQAILQMDADFSHNPSEIPNFLKNLKNSDFIIGSRYITGGDVSGWDKKRILLSKLGNLYAKLILGFAINDWTAGFVCWRVKVLKKIIKNQIDWPNGYSFQIALKFLALISGFKLKEIPIIFKDRIYGKTKLGNGIINEAVVTILRLRILKKMLLDQLRG